MQIYVRYTHMSRRIMHWILVHYAVIPKLIQIRAPLTQKFAQMAPWENEQSWLESEGTEWSLWLSQVPPGPPCCRDQ